MVILGINASHLATACILVDGELKACISEERLNRIKNCRDLPVLAIKEVLSISGYLPNDIDLMVFGFKDPKNNTSFAADPGAIMIEKSYQGRRSVIKKIAWFLKETLLIKIPGSSHYYNLLMDLFYSVFVDPSLNEQLFNRIENEIGISRKKVKFIDHHTAHIYAAIFTFPNLGKKKLLALTADGMGDGLCATVRTVKNQEIEVIAKTEKGNSLGDIYSFTTKALGMKIAEHEYKVMGLAPYANQNYIKEIYKKLKELIWINDDLTFSTKINSTMFQKILPKIYTEERFDNISGAIQLLAEDLLVEWVRKAVKKTGINDVVCAGGVFMNVKANQKILELPEVKSLYVMPSSGDETTSMGAAYWAYDTVGGEWKDIKQLEHLYLGTDYSSQQIAKEIKKLNRRKYKAEKCVNIEKEIAELLSEGNIVARFYGPMEFGARALGNRSILANPANLDSIREINEGIKSRDFWMPFAPSILEERQNDYIKNPKNYPANYMTITFDSTEKARRDLKAAMHPYDYTLRPQIVRKNINSGYHKLISEFEKLTGIGAVLNTSFNLHGYPIVMSPKDALDVLERSGLKYLAIGDFLVSKF